jgi:hypothetical protein
MTLGESKRRTPPFASRLFEELGTRYLSSKYHGLSLNCRKLPESKCSAEPNLPSSLFELEYFHHP